MIKHLEIVGLWGRENFTFAFHPDLNILTGRNGSGKTTILKLLWYLVSGHARQALAEVEFDRASTAAEAKGTYHIELTKNSSSKLDMNGNGLVVPGDSLFSIQYTYATDAHRGQQLSQMEAQPLRKLYSLVGEEIAPMSFTTLFLPTFRRFEGGFSIGGSSEGNKITEGLREFSYRLTHAGHRFVAYADYEDVKRLINEISSDIRVRLQPVEEEFMSFVKTPNPPPNFAEQLTERIAKKEKREAEIKAPLTKLAEYIDFFFLEKSVEVTEELVLGSHVNRAKLAHLSAGEKNLLSFLVYAMEQPAAMFIDEPELNLHVDWQRHLLSVLRAIAPNTQFFVATYASAIRAAYPEKQFFLDNQLVEA
jgi:predicted ATPase